MAKVNILYLLYTVHMFTVRQHEEGGKKFLILHLSCFNTVVNTAVVNQTVTVNKSAYYKHPIPFSIGNKM